MVTLRSRGEIVGPTETVQLHASFYDGYGNLADLDTFPKVSIIQPSGNVTINQTGMGVYRLNTGIYGFDYTLGINPSLGVWSDIWQGTMNGLITTGTLNFVVYTTQMPMINSDGYEALGDDPGFNYSQVAIHNINKLLKSLKARLNSAGKAKSKDPYGNDIYIDCDIYTLDTLVTFLADSLTYFNSIPHFTMFTFEDTSIINQFHHILVQGAATWAMASKALIERGREYQITDNGVSFTPPTVSELLNTEWSAELNAWREDIKAIKGSMKSFPLGLGGLSFATSRNPVIDRLRMLRARQIF